MSASDVLRKCFQAAQGAAKDTMVDESDEDLSEEVEADPVLYNFIQTCIFVVSSSFRSFI